VLFTRFLGFNHDQVCELKQFLLVSTLFEKFWCKPRRPIKVGFVFQNLKLKLEFAQTMIFHFSKAKPDMLSLQTENSNLSDRSVETEEFRHCW